MDKIEGIYEATGSYKDIEIPCRNIYNQTLCSMTWRAYDPKYKVAMIKQNNEYKLIYISSNPKGMEKVGGCNCDGKSYIEPPINEWYIGDAKATLYKTAVPNLFKCDWYMRDKTLNTDGYISFENSSYFTYVMGDDKTMYLKLYPTSDDDTYQSTDKIEPSSGTGFAISSKGIIATNYHVTNGSKDIKVRGINGDFSKSFKTKILVEDKNNDLSIIQITDSSFTSLGQIPYTIFNKTADVGCSVYALGYPLKAVMGDEIKLTNGIISSRSGYQGDVTSYQISVPLQPGNSGGPLFDYNGNIVGIVNAKLTIGENVSYAIKSSYLLNLVEILQDKILLPTNNTLIGKTLSTQVKSLNKFVYIIEIN